MPETFEALDFHDYHRRTLPAAVEAGRGVLAAAGPIHLDPLAVRIAETGDAYTYHVAGGGVEIVAGDADATTVVEVAHSLLVRPSGARLRPIPHG